MLNSSFIQGFELDDYHPLAPLHSNCLVIPAMLAATPQLGRGSGAQFLRGAVLGYETAPRLRDGAAGWTGARRPRNDLPRLALGRGLRPPVCRRVRRKPVRTGRRR